MSKTLSPDKIAKRKAKQDKRSIDIETLKRADTMSEQEIINKALSLLEQGKTMSAAAQSVGRSASWLYEIARDDVANSAAIARARALGYRVVADDIIEIADATDPDSPGTINKARLQTDVRKWILSKMLPQQFGDKVTIAGDANNPLQINIAELPTDQLRAKLAEFIVLSGKDKQGQTIAD